jgi:hypothetical protein
MKRVLIIGIVLVAIWLVFNKANENQDQVQELSETASLEEITETKKELESSLLKIEEVTEKKKEMNLDAKTKEKKEVIISQKKNVVRKKQSFPKPTDYAFDSRLKVYLYEWGIDISSTAVLPGNIEFEVVNNGQFTHHFSIKEVQNFGKVLPGETRVFVARLEEGEFELFSPRNIDVENGMNETLYVGE